MEQQGGIGVNGYLARFYDPRVTAYEFLKCFFAYLKKKDVHQIDRDLVGFLRAQKAKEENKDVLEEINFRTNGVNYYSYDLEDALFNLQNGGLLGKMNPSFGIIIINYSDYEIEDAIQSVPEQYRKSIEKIAIAYKNNIQ